MDGRDATALSGLQKHLGHTAIAEPKHKKGFWCRLGLHRWYAPGFNCEECGEIDVMWHPPMHRPSSHKRGKNDGDRGTTT